MLLHKKGEEKKILINYLLYYAQELDRQVPLMDEIDTKVSVILHDVLPIRSWRQYEYFHKCFCLDALIGG